MKLWWYVQNWCMSLILSACACLLTETLCWVTLRCTLITKFSAHLLQRDCGSLLTWYILAVLLLVCWWFSFLTCMWYSGKFGGMIVWWKCTGSEWWYEIVVWFCVHWVLPCRCDHHVTWNRGCAVAQAVASFPPWWPRFKHKSSHVGFVVDKVALGQVFSKYFSFPYQSFIPLIVPQ
jgi:hypothetical protein